MKRKRIILPSVIIALGVLIFFFVQSRLKHEGIKYSNLNAVCFERDILPVFIKNCGAIGCHDKPSAAAGYVLVDYTSIIKGVTPFNPDKSIAYQAIIGDKASLMPPGMVLTENEKTLIEVWIGQGAVNTRCNSLTTRKRK